MNVTAPPDDPAGAAPESRAPRFERIPARRAFEVVCDQIRAQVARGALRPGDKLPTERELAEQFGISRLGVREALRSLENAGVVVLVRGAKGGAFIQAGENAKFTEMMQDMLHLGKFPLRDLTEARIYILDSVARLACERATQEDLDGLELSVQRSEALVTSDDRETRIQEATDFYTRLAAATRNKVMILVVQALTDILLAVLRSIEVYPSAALASSRRRFMEQLVRRDADRAAAELRLHLTQLHEHIERCGAGGPGRRPGSDAHPQQIVRGHRVP